MIFWLSIKPVLQFIDLLILCIENLDEMFQLFPKVFYADNIFSEQTHISFLRQVSFHLSYNICSFLFVFCILEGLSPHLCSDRKDVCSDWQKLSNHGSCGFFKNIFYHSKKSSWGMFKYNKLSISPYFTRCHPNIKIWDSFNFLWVYIVIFGQSFAVYMFIILIISTHLVQSESHFSLNESWRVLSLKKTVLKCLAAHFTIKVKKAMLLKV